MNAGKITTGTSLMAKELSKGSLAAELSLPSTFPEEFDEEVIAKMT